MCKCKHVQEFIAAGFMSKLSFTSCLDCDAIGVFHVTSYQADFASHRTFDRHVGFLLVWCGIGKHNKMSRNF